MPETTGGREPSTTQMRLAAILLLTRLLAGQTAAQTDPAKLAALGAAMSRDFEKSHTVLNDPVVAEYVATLGALAKGRFPPAARPYTFRVVKSDGGGPSHIPLAFPGGYVYVPTRLIQNVENEAELVNMIAQSILNATNLPVRAQSGGVPLILGENWENTPRVTAKPILANPGEPLPDRLKAIQARLNSQ